MLTLQLLIVFSVYVIFQCQEVIKVNFDKNIRIAFGSCNKFYRNHQSSIFFDIALQTPDLFVWLGDIAYVDNMYLPGLWFPEEDEKKIRMKYETTKNDSSYQLMKSFARVVGVWDDHDYGINNGGYDMKNKQAVQQIIMDFLDEPQNSTRRTANGIYTSYYIGQEKKIKLILLDVRYNKDKQNQEMLGEEQWQWLEKEFKDENPQIILLGTGTQFLPDDRFIPESWYPKNRERLYKLIRETKKSVIILSGDIHMAEIMQHPCGKQLIGYDLYEVTSSGLSFNFDNISPYINEFANHLLFTETYNDQRHFQSNYGFIEIEFEETQTIINLQVYGKKNVSIPKIQKTINLKDITYNEANLLNNQNATCIVNEITPFNRLKSYFINGLIEQTQALNWRLFFFIFYQTAQIIALVLFFIYMFKIITGKVEIIDEKKKQQEQIQLQQQLLQQKKQQQEQRYQEDEYEDSDESEEFNYHEKYN